MRIAFIVSHPIQYYVPIYRELERRIRHTAEGIRPEAKAGGIRQADDCQPSLRDRPVAAGQLILTADDSARISALKVFYTWRDAGPARDVKFGKEFAWDIPLMEGYDFEVVPNTSPDPGTHHRKGLINPDLVERVKAWKPDVVHITGYNYISHGQAIKELSKAGIPVIFRGDSHLLDGRGPWWKWMIKKSWLSKVYSWPKGFAYVGKANRDYYRAFGVPERKLFPVPHTIEVGRFAEPNEELEAKALTWRRELGIPDDHFVFLYAAKLEPRKRPMELLEAFLRADLPKATLLFVGSGELEEALKERAEGTSHGLTRIGTDKFSGGDTAGKSLLPRNAADKEQSFSHSRPEGTEDSPQANRQLEELSEAVKLTRMKGRISPLGGAERTGQECSVLGDPSTRNAPSEEAEDCKLTSDDCAHRVFFVPFQNQSAMPLVYRLGDALVLPSGYGETWGLAVNEAQACGRPSLVSDCVGCARDIIREGENGAIFRTDDWEDCARVMRQMVDAWSEETKRQPSLRDGLPCNQLIRDEEPSVASRREAIRAGAWEFDTARGVDALLSGIRQTA